MTMRQAGATGRAMLEAAAARHWRVPVGEVTARLHQVLHPPTGRLMPFGALASLAKTLPVPGASQLTLKEPSAFRYIGVGVPMVDLHDMTCGRAHYGMDQCVEGMRYAVVARPRVCGGSVASFNSAAAERVPGVVRVVPIAHPAPLPSGMAPLGGMAVVATSTWVAIRGRDALEISWNDGPDGNYDSVAFRDALVRTGRQPGTVIRRQGDAISAIDRAPRRLVAEYYVPHLAHAPLVRTPWPRSPTAAARCGHRRKTPRVSGISSLRHSASR
jgi:isoquinoline 1-oxidoreductase beta subunit